MGKMTITEAANEIGITRASLRSAVNRGVIPSVKDESINRTFVELEDVLAWREAISTGEVYKQAGSRAKATRIAKRGGMPTKTMELLQEYSTRREERKALRAQGYVSLADIARIEGISRQAVGVRYSGVPFIAVGSKKFVIPIIRAKHVAAYTAYYKGIGLEAPVMATPAGEGD